MKSSNIKIHIVIVSQPFAFSKYDLLGRTALDYLCNSFKSIPFVIVDCEKDINIKTKYDYLAVVYADMPLITERFLQKVARTMRQRQIEKINIGKGYIAKYGTNDTVLPSYNLKTVETLSISDAKTFNIVYNVLKCRIVEKHLQAGVLVLDFDNTVIDDTVIIESGVVIEPFCIIKGRTVIKQNTKVKSFTTIENNKVL